jgi:16S rRNA processing protein RimM
MNNDLENLLEIGQIATTHGLRGDLKVRLNSGDPDLLMSMDRVALCLPSGTMLDLEIIRQVVHKGQVLLRFKGYESINDAEPLIRSKVLVAEDTLPELGEGEYYWKQLEGLRIVDQDRGDIGTLKDIYSTAAHDTYIVDGRFGEVLIPVVKEFVLDIDLEAGVVTVALPQGLVPEEL